MNLFKPPAFQTAFLPARHARWFATAAVLCSAAISVAEPLQQPPVAIERAATLRGRELLNLPYVTGGNARQRLDLFPPQQRAPGTTANPLIVWIHGGSWNAGDKGGCPAKWMTQRGYAVVSLDYRLSQDAIYPAQLEDCKAAIRWVRAHASEYGIDPQRIGVWGGSAGGHLVALLGTTGSIRDFDVGENLDQSSAVQCVVDWFGPSDFQRWSDHPVPELDTPESVVAKLLGGTVAANPAKARRASPIEFIRKDAAPFLIMHGDKDTVVPLHQSELLNAALQKAGAQTTLKIVAGAGHGGPQFATASSMLEVLNFFDLHLHPSAATTR